MHFVACNIETKQCLSPSNYTVSKWALNVAGCEIWCKQRKMSPDACDPDISRLKATRQDAQMNRREGGLFRGIDAPRKRAIKYECVCVCV